MGKHHDLIIVGGGFAGVYAAWRFAGRGLRVALIEASERLGGSMDAFEWRGFWVDHGCHFLDLRLPESAHFFEDVLGSELMELDRPRWGVAVDGSWVDGFEFPDFTGSPEFCRAALDQMAGLRGTYPEPDGPSWLDWFRATRGEHLAAAVGPMVTKATGADPARVSPDGRRSLQMFNRVRLGDDAEMIALKSTDPFWDERLAVTLAAADPRFTGLNRSARFGYPRRQGLHGFGVAAANRLRERGVDLILGKAVRSIEPSSNGVVVALDDGSLSTDRLFWSLPEYALCDTLGIGHALRSTAIPVGSAFWAFEVDSEVVLGPDYLHDYSARLPFRVNKAGVYSRQVRPDGRTYVMAEIPGHPAQLASHRAPEARDASWRAMLETGYIAADAVWTDAVSWSLPVAFTLPTLDWHAEYLRIQAAVSAISPRIHGIDFGFRGRNAFIQFCQERLEPAILAGETSRS